MERKFLKIIVILIFISVLQSCILAGLGAAIGGGGYYAGEKASSRDEERMKTQAQMEAKKDSEQKQQAASAADQNISNQINQSFVAGSLSQQIAIYPEVRNGVVILHGRVPDAATAERAIQAAQKTPGVNRIISNLVILNNQYPQYYIQGGGYAQPSYLPQNGAPVPPMPEQLKYVPVQEQNHSSIQGDKFHKLKNGNIKNSKDTQISSGSEKIHKQSPPLVSKEPDRVEPQNPRALPENLVQKYSQDDDSEYKEYKPPILRQGHHNVKPDLATSPQQNQIRPIQAPLPYYTNDNDNLYRPLGAFSPNPISTNHPPQMPGNKIIPLPEADPLQDNDSGANFQYYDN